MPKHVVSAINVVEKFLYSPNLVMIPHRIIIGGGSICVFVGNIPHNFSILKEVLLDNLFGVSGIPSIVVESEIIPFNHDGTHHDVSKQKPISREFAK